MRPVIYDRVVPGLTVAQALTWLRAHTELLCWDSGPQGPCYVAIPTERQPLYSLVDLPDAASGVANCDAYGWPLGLTGGWFIQCDYGFPVGGHAAAVSASAPAGRAARLDAWLVWNAAGECRLQGRQTAAVHDLERALRADPTQQLALASGSAPQPQWDGPAHQDKVQMIREAIADGTCFQANLAVPFHGQLGPEPHQDVALFLALRAASPAPYACFWRQAPLAGRPGRSICSHSPECFLQGDQQLLRSEPIKGTRRRQVGNEAAVCAELLAAVKDRAELAMIVDLVRNDLGRIARPGSVQVTSAARILNLDYVHHLVATVTARPRADTTVSDWLAAAYPAGSITGAPKIEVMRLLQDLEGGERGAYCGTFGWLGERACALAVAIRTMEIHAQAVRFYAGGGIVADSDPAAEWQEVLAKAARMAQVLS